MIDIFSYDLVLFDFDGLLVDTEPLHFQAYQRALEKKGFFLDWDFSRYCLAAHLGADGIEQGIYQTFPELKKEFPDWSQIRKEKNQILQSILEEGTISWMPGAEKLLEQLQTRQIPHGVVTNSHGYQTQEIQKHLKALKNIPFWVTRDDGFKPKPSPEPYLHAIKAFTGMRILGFEDTCKGIEALNRAGIPGVLVSPPMSPQMEQQTAHYTIEARLHSLESIREYIS